MFSVKWKLCDIVNHNFENELQNVRMTVMWYNNNKNSRWYCLFIYYAWYIF